MDIATFFAGLVVLVGGTATWTLIKHRQPAPITARARNRRR